MSDNPNKTEALPFTIAHATSEEELTACFPVISLLRTYLVDADDWISRAHAMAPNGYRVVAAWQDGKVVAVAGYRIMQNLIHHRFLYVDDLVTASDQRGQGLGAALLKELAAVGANEKCNRLVLDTAAANTDARRFYKREGLLDVVVGFVKPL
jgi:ribosomal protein S18 acetylase RimI-like enzyme